MFKIWFWSLRVLGAVYRRGAMRVATRLHRASLSKVGPGTRFQAGVRFDRPHRVEIGADCYFWSGVGAAGGCESARLRVGDRVHVNLHVLLDTEGGLTLGDDVVISEHAVISTHDHGHNPHSSPVPVSKEIGPDAWIGMRAIILSSCRSIGAGAIIGAGAVVTRNVPAGAIVAGNPARVVGHRAKAEVAA